MPKKCPGKKSPLLVLLALSSAYFMGCSSPTSPKKSACACEKDKPITSTVKPTVGQDSIVKAAKAAGKGVITGALQGEGKDVIKGLLKTAGNAAGERRLLSTTPVPLQAATILIFDALRATTSAETTLTTDKNGNYTAVLKDGKYYGFAVHLDLSTFRLITAAIPFIHCKRDTLAVIDTAIAIEDLTHPSVTGVYDATSPDASGLFLVGPIAAKNAQISVMFSEPLQRESIGSLIVGRLDAANINGSFILKDTLLKSSIKSSWSGDSKQLTLKLGNLEAGTRYGVFIPTSLKDLAKNPLEKEYTAIFEAVSETQVSDLAFNVNATFPAEKEALKPTQNPQISFSRPPHIFSALNSVSIKPILEGYWEVTGTKLTFIHKDPLAVGATYTVNIPDTLTDLSGKKLEKGMQWSFTVKDYEGAAKDKKGRDQTVALIMEEFFNAYLQGDIGRLAGFLDPVFRMEVGTQLFSSQQFLDQVRRTESEKSQLNSGFLAPIYQTTSQACSTKSALRKVTSTDKTDTLWVQARIAPGILPKIYRTETILSSGITWSKSDNRFSLEGKEYIFDIPTTRANEEGGDFRFLGEQLKMNSSVLLEPVKQTISEQFSIDGGISVTESEAKVAVKLSTITAQSRKNWDPILACDEPSKKDTSYKIMKFILGFTGTKWVVKHALDNGRVEQNKFTQIVSASEFKVKEIKPITLLGPTNGIEGAGGTLDQVQFRFRGLELDSVGGYLIGLAEDPKFTGGRANSGGLYFVKNQGIGKEQIFTLGSQAQGVAGASSILRDVQALNLPGWEKATFKFPIVELFNPSKGIAGVYLWKAIAIRDTSAAQFLSHGFQPDRFYGESDFGPAKGAFAVRGYPKADDFKALDTQIASIPAAQANIQSFADKDLDGFPDFIELNYKTNLEDKTSFPNFLVDTDRDGLADFLEMRIDPSGIEREATPAEKKAGIEALSTVHKITWVDLDADGIPDDIEKLLGYNPNDAASKPATHARVSPPSGLFSGLLKLGDNTYLLKFKVRQQADTLSVAYSALLKDTLIDTVRADLNEAMGEFLFPIRLPDYGPDSGKSLLLRATYDKNRALLSGSMHRIPSLAKNSIAFIGGPLVGQYAASGRGEDVSAFLGISKSPLSPSPTLLALPAAQLDYRQAPSGLGNARLSLKPGIGKLYVLTLVDEFGDTYAVLDSTHAYAQEDGTYDIDARQTQIHRIKQVTRRIALHGRLGRGKDSLINNWILDGSMTESIDSCRRFDATTPTLCLDKLYREVPGQFSARVKSSDASVKIGTYGISGDFSGWLQQDKFGTGLTDGAASTSQPTGGTGGATGSGTSASNEPLPPESFSKSFSGTALQFQTFLEQAGIAPGEPFYVSMRGRVMRSIHDSVHIRSGAFPYCGNVQIKVIPIPLVDGATPNERIAFSKDSILATSNKYTVLAIEDEAQIGSPAKLEKARDALGFVRTHVFLVESRYIDPSAFLGGKCLDGGVLPPPAPQDAGLPIRPSGSQYFRGDLATLKSALSTSGNKISLVKTGGTSVTMVEINLATLRIDPDSKAALAANIEDPSLGYVLLGQESKPGIPLLTDGLPTGLALP